MKLMHPTEYAKGSDPNEPIILTPDLNDTYARHRGEWLPIFKTRTATSPDKPEDIPLQIEVHHDPTA
jgi:hypothetical protein